MRGRYPIFSIFKRGELMQSCMRKYCYGIFAIAAVAISFTSSCAGGRSCEPTISVNSHSQRGQMLVDALALEMAARGVIPARAVSVPPAGDCNRPSSFQAIPDGVGGWMLSWRYVNHGDYNLDGAVNIADITPIAAHFGEPSTIIGGDGTATVGVGDVTPIAQHFATELAGYIVEAAPLEAGPFEEIGRVHFAELKDVGGWPFGQLPLAAIDNRYYRVTPYDAEETRGISSSVYTPSLSAPVITAVRPLTCGKGVAAVFQADVTGEGLKSYRWSFGEFALPNASEDEHPSVIFTQAGEFHCSLTVNTAFGFDQLDFTVIVVESGDAPFITRVQPKSALVGVPVVFGAVVGGQEPLAYSWSFQAGVPSTSTETSPEVTFVQPGSHEVSLTVANAIDSAVYTLYLDAVQGLELDLVAIRLKIEGTKNTLSSSIYYGRNLFAMPLSGNAQGEGEIGSDIHGYLEGISYTYLPEDQMYGFDDAPPSGKAVAYNATLEYLRSSLEWSIALNGYTEPELITHNPGELPGELLGTIGMVIGLYTVQAELPAGVFGLSQPMQVVIDMDFKDAGGLGG